MRVSKATAFLSIITLFTLAACGPNPLDSADPLAYVPQEVTSVAAVNVERLMDKADFDQLRKMPLYADILDKVQRENAAFARIMGDPARAGVDLEQNIYLTFELEREGRSGMAALVFAMADKEAFERVLNELELQFLPAGNEPGLLRENGTALVWNEAAGVLGIGAGDSIQQRAGAYLQTEPERSVSSNRNLRSALSREFDMLHWLSSEAFVELFDLSAIGKAARYTEADLKENYLQTFVVFEDGQMRAETEYHLQRKLAADLALVMNDEVATDFSDKLPHEKLLFYANFGIRPKGINQLLVEYHVKGLSDQPFKSYGLETDDLIEAFSGDVAAAIYQDTGQRFLFPNLLLAIDINSREHLDRLLNAGMDADMIRETGPDRYQLLRNAPDSSGNAQRAVEMEMLIQGDLLYLSDRADLLATIQAGTFAANGEIPRRVGELTARQAMAALINVAWLSQVEDDLQALPVTAVEAVGGQEKAALTVRMKQAETNSLRQLFQWMNDQYVREQEARRPAADEKI